MSKDNEATKIYICKLAEAKIFLSIYLTNGLRMDGKIKTFDDESIIINDDQLIMRNAIATIQPKR